jgi:hypothetical protein
VEEILLRKWPGITMFAYMLETIHTIVKYVGKTSKQNLQFTVIRNVIPKYMLYLVPLVRNIPQLSTVFPFTYNPIHGRDHIPVIKDSLPIVTC